jgi:hypothetical protein
MDLVVVFLLLCFIAWLRKLDLCRPASASGSLRGLSTSLAREDG